ncbi:hypothetical protein HZA45_01050 [Candidatus Peregrinibacteria bacterium]|nr:hypothetical protein [Candidatus Peregrinibacteria bacterium]
MTDHGLQDRLEMLTTGNIQVANIAELLAGARAKEIPLWAIREALSRGFTERIRRLTSRAEALSQSPKGASYFRMCAEETRVLLKQIEQGKDVVLMCDRFDGICIPSSNRNNSEEFLYDL